MNKSMVSAFVLSTVTFLTSGTDGRSRPEFQRSAPRDIALSVLNKRFRNAIVRIEFTMVMNVVETKLNPTKSERYYGHGSEPSHGTGFFIRENEILTNAHVVERARYGSIRVKSPATGNVEFRVEVVGVGGSEEIDIAVLRMPEDEVMRFKKRSGLSKVPTLKFGDSDKVRLADPVAIFGYPSASDELKVIQAEVTGRQYLTLEFGRFMCPHQLIEVGPGGVVQSGNSGGPALDRHGIVVGVPAFGSGYGSEQGWLIPANIITHYLDRIRNSEAGAKSLHLPRLGVVLAENFPGTAVLSGAPDDYVIFELGVVVSRVLPGSLADKWGLESDDIIVGYANRQKGLSSALDFRGYRVVTGKMRNWPPDKTSKAKGVSELPKLHLSEMVMMSEEGDDVTLWYIDRESAKSHDKASVKEINKTFRHNEAVPLPHLGPYQRPDFELWGDFVAQDFNDYNVRLFDVPAQEVLKGGVLVTFVEPNSLARRRGMEPKHRSPWAFSGYGSGTLLTRWVIIETVNGDSIHDLTELRTALRAAEKKFKTAKKAPDYKPVNRILLDERYVEIGFRTNTGSGNTIALSPAFPIDESLECRKNLARRTARQAIGSAQ